MKRIAEFMGAMLLAGAMAGSAFQGDACTRIVYHGTDSLYVVARSLDWKTPIPTNLYVYPRGMEKRSSDQDNCHRWVSRYGAVYAVGYDGGITEGMNEKGLCINGLFCKPAIYEKDLQNNNKPYMSLAMFVAWMLDNCATTDEVVEMLRPRNFRIQGAAFDGGTASTLHWGVTDATGHSVIFEFNQGDLKVYEMEDYWAMTNDPMWPDMRAIVNYWNKIGGKNMLPGTVSSPDRCVRANFFAHHVQAVSDRDLGVAISRSLLVNVSVPYTYLIEGEPNLSSTQWRSYADLRDKCYYFEVVTNPGYYYIDLTKLNLKPGAPVLKLDASNTSDLVGCANSRLKKNPGFTPMW